MIKLKDLINEQLGSDVWYHGRTVDNSSFSLDYVGGKNAYDQEGPGFYFTSDFGNAKRYAEHKGIVLKCKINYKKLILKTNGSNTKSNKKIVVDLINKSPDRDSVLENFNEDINKAFVEATNAYMTYKYAWDTYQTIANDFYKHNPKQYLECLSKYYDAQWTTVSDNIIHLIVYTPSIISIIEKINL